MNDETIKNNILRQKILSQIQEGKLKMRPKAFFVCQVIVLSIVVFFTFIISIFLISYILFTIKSSGNMYLLGYGKRGLYEFLMVFPWLIFILDMVLLLFLDWLLKKFEFGYHSPVIYLFVGTLLVITGGGTLLNFTSINEVFMREANHKNLAVVGPLYKDIGRSHVENGIFYGEVVSIATSSFVMRDKSDENDDGVLFTVFFPSNVSTSSFISLGDKVLVAGDLTKDEIMAYGLSKLAQKK